MVGGREIGKMMKIEEDKDEKLKASPLGDDLYKYYYTTTHQRNTNNRAILHQPKTSRVLPTPSRATEHQNTGHKTPSRGG